jgi:hypothetical protein
MSRGRKAALGLAVVIASLVAITWQPWQEKTVASASSQQPTSAASKISRPTEEQQFQSEIASSKQRVISDWAALLKWLSSDPPPDAEEVRERLLATRTAWVQLDPQALASAIQELLESGVDAKTGLDFEVGLHGMLAGWPTLRVFLLDALAISDPEMGMVIASDLLDKTASADEFATGLRSLTRTDLARAPDAELLARFDQMLGRKDWHSTRGFAEAFDLTRFVGTPAAARKLVAWDSNSELRSMAMHEFAADHPAAMLETLETDVAIESPDRASLVARADPADPRQLGSVDNYLHRPELTPEEATAFFNAFPLRSATTGFRLYGSTPSPYTFEQIKSGDLAAGEAVNRWLADPTLEAYRPQIQALQQRLANWIEEAK